MKNKIRNLIPKQLITLAEEAYRRTRVAALNLRYGHPAKGLNIIAVTGTNGKTSTALYINDILKAAGKKTALSTTTVLEINGKSEINKTHRTVPTTGKLLEFYQKCHAAEVDVVIMEVTSQGLQQHRLDGMQVNGAVFTNLTPDHLDYHGTMQRYADAKKILFGRKMKPKHCILNADDDYFEEFKKASAGEVSSYGFSHESEYGIRKMKQSARGMTWEVQLEEAVVSLSIPHVGSFNAANATAAALVCSKAGLATVGAIQKGLADSKPMPGRMEVVAGSGGIHPLCIVDFAHTPDAAQKVLEATRGLVDKKGKLICITGASGDRSLSRRGPVGEHAALLSDILFVTDDEPGSEDPAKIRSAVIEGTQNVANSKRARVIEIPDRFNAVKQAFETSSKDDVIILIGMGRQTSRLGRSGPEPWDDYEVFKDVIAGKTNKDSNNWRKLYPAG